MIEMKRFQTTLHCLVPSHEGLEPKLDGLFCAFLVAKAIRQQLPITALK